MASATNWLSFSLSPMEVMRSSTPTSDHPSQFISYEGSSSTTHQYFLDNFYANGYWSINTNPKEPQAATATTMGEEAAPQLTSFIDPSVSQTLTLTHQTAPKLEDFLRDHNSCHTETTQDDSSLTHIYFNNDPQDLKAIAGFQAFSSNSGSEVDDSVSIVRAEFHSTESGGSGSDLGFASCGNISNGLSLGVNDNNGSNGNINNNTSSTHLVSMEKAIVVAGEDSDSSNKKIVDTFGQRTSIYRGVTRHRWTGRYEAHLWDNSCKREGQARKGRQVYLGGYDKEEKAARAYDLAALKYWGATATTNFPVINYAKELEDMKYMSKQEFIASLRRKSSGFSRGASIYRGVTRHHQQGRWQARIGRVAGNKDLYLGTFATEEEAAEAYDIAAIKFRGLNAVTNFEMSRYDVEAIMKSALPIGGAGKRLKLESEQKAMVVHDQQPQCSSSKGSNNISFNSVQPIPTIPCGIPFDNAPPFYHHNIFNHFLPANNFGSVDPYGSGASVSAPTTMVQQTPEFFIWPHHQSY